MLKHSVRPLNQAMETTRLAQYPLPRFLSYTDDRFPRKCHLAIRDFGVSERPRRCFARLSTQFSDSGHQQYYVSQMREAKKKEKQKSSEIELLKKKLKFIKRLSHDLTMFSVETSGEESANALVDDEKISGAVEILKAQLLQLKSEQKELKRRRKEKKSQIKTSLRQTKNKCKSESSSSSSSDSRDSERGEVIDMTCLRNKAVRKSKDREEQEKIEEATLAKPCLLIQQDKSEEALGIGDGDSSSRNHSESECGSGSNGCSDDQSDSIVAETQMQSIEICMGDKCKKLGAETLLQEFDRRVGLTLGVSGCKCMGKCKDGPNLRFLNGRTRDEARKMQGHVRTSITSLCIGVGLEDVDVILPNFLAKDENNKYLMAHS